MFITQNCRTHTRLFVSNVTKPILWIHSVTLCAASALSLYYVIDFFFLPSFFCVDFVVFCCDAVMHYLVFNSLYTAQYFYVFYNSSGEPVIGASALWVRPSFFLVYKINK
jgi:hypothetical protein